MRRATAEAIPATTNRDAAEAVPRRPGNRAASGPDRTRRARGDGRRGPQKASQWRLPSATTRESRRLDRLSTVRDLGRCAEPGRSPASSRATFARAPASRTAGDRPAATRLRQIAVRGNPRNEEIAATYGPTKRDRVFYHVRDDDG